jgi:hypothetical protein
MKLIDTTRDPKIYPQDAVLVFNTVKAVLAKFSRFGSQQNWQTKSQNNLPFFGQNRLLSALFSLPAVSEESQEKTKKETCHVSRYDSPHVRYASSPFYFSSCTTR